MKSNMKELQILISAPSDVKKEIDIAIKIIENFNVTTGRVNNITLIPIHWQRDSFHEEDESAQKLLNQQIYDDSDIVLAIYKTKFTSQSGLWDSGTEEIERILEDKKPIFLYFSTMPFDFSKVDIEQHQKIRKFKNDYQSRRIYHIYDSLEKFEREFSNHLNTYFLNEVINKKSLSFKEERESKLTLHSYDGAAISDSLIFLSSNYKESKFIKDKVAEIKEKIDEIGNINIFETGSTMTSDREQVKKRHTEDIALEEKRYANNSRYLDIIESNKEIIFDFIDNNAVELDSSWLEFGKIKKKPSLLSLFGSGKRSSNNPKVEIEEFNKVLWIIREMKELNEYYEYFEFLDNSKLLNLIIKNCGTRDDEDISITLYLPKGKVLLKDDLENPKENIIDDMIEFTDYIFKPSGMHYVKNYPDYEKNHVNDTVNIPDLQRNEGLENLYRKKLRKYLNRVSNLFLFKYSESEEFDVLTFHQSYLKNNEMNFFPCSLLFKDEVELIKYEITSKYSSKKIRGVLEQK